MALKLIHRVFYNNDAQLLHNPLYEQQRLFILQAMAATAVTLLSTGSVLNGLMLKLGFSDSLTSIVALFPNIIGIVAVFAPMFWERVARRKRPLAIMLIVARALIFCLSLTALLPFDARQPVFIALKVLACVLSSSAAIAVNIWFVAIAPEEIRGRYTSMRMMFSLIVSIALPPCSGILLDVMGRSFLSYGIVLFMSMAFGLLEVRYFWRMAEPEYAPLPRVNIKSMFTIPVKNAKFMRFLLIMFLFYIITQMSCAVTQVYMLKYLGFSYTYIAIISSLMAVYQFIAYRSVGRLQDKLGPTRMMQIGILLIATEICIWGFTPPAAMMYVLPLAYLFAASGNAAFNIAIFSRRYQIIPREGGSLFEGMYIAVVGVALLLGPLLGTALRSAILAVPALESFEFAQFRVGYILTTALMVMLVAADGIMSRLESRPR